MIIAIDFDGTVVKQEHAFDDLATPLELIEGAAEALQSLKRAGHLLLLYSARANAAHRIDPRLSALVRAGKIPLDWEKWQKRKHVVERRYQQMIEFVNTSLPGVFDAIDDGMQGKPSADLYVDDRAFFNPLEDWPWLAARFGEPVEADVPLDSEALDDDG